VTSFFELLKYGQKELKTASDEEAMLDSQILLQEAFNLTKSQLLAQLKDSTEDFLATKKFKANIKKRKARIPLAHILKYFYFRDHKYDIKPGVFIGRPETELLVEKITHVIRDNNLNPAKINLFEFGFGSGVISIETALNYPQMSEMYAWDKSKKAYATAQANAQRLGSQNINFIHKDFFKNLAFFKKITNNENVNIFVSNPPYIPNADIKALQIEVQNHDPKAALKGGGDGLRIYKRLLRILKSVKGYFLFEIGINQKAPLTLLLQKHSYKNFEFFNDYNGIPRVLVIDKKRQ
jgi:release factor glutamine methyltransferase